MNFRSVFGLFIASVSCASGESKSFLPHNLQAHRKTHAPKAKVLLAPHKPVVKDPVVKDPVVQEPFVKDHVVFHVKEPVVKEPVVDEPVAKEEVAVAQEAPEAPKIPERVEKVEIAPDTPAPAEGQVVQQLQHELVEMKLHRTQIAQMREALKADTSLLRETIQLKKIAQTEAARVAAETQLRQATQLVKTTQQMLQEAKGAAAASSDGALRQLRDVRQAVDALSTEATEQARLFEKAGAKEASATDESVKEVAAPSKVESSEPPRASSVKAASTKAAAVDDDVDLDIDDDNN